MFPLEQLRHKVPSPTNQFFYHLDDHLLADQNNGWMFPQADPPRRPDMGDGGGGIVNVKVTGVALYVASVNWTVLLISETLQGQAALILCAPAVVCIVREPGDRPGA